MKSPTHNAKRKVLVRSFTHRGQESGAGKGVQIERDRNRWGGGGPNTGQGFEET